MTINCEYCNTVFKTKSALNNHKNKAKYCLVIQKKIESPPEKDVFKCSICDKLLSSKQRLEIHREKCGKTKTKTKSSKLEDKKVFKCEYCEKNVSTKQNLSNHLSVCFKRKDKQNTKLKELRENELKELKKLKDEIIEKDKIIIKVNTQLENYKEQLEKKEKQEENYKEQIKDLQEKLDKIANKAIDRPTTVVSNTTTNNNLNIVSSLDFNNFDRIKDAIENKLNVNHVVDGQKGLAKFMVDTILTDEGGNLLYVCTDPSRNMFKYKNTDGEINKDVEAKKLISFMVDAGIKGKSFEIAREWYKNGDEENGDVDMTKYGIMVNPQEKIMKIEDESSRFKRELASMTSVN